MIAVKVLIVNLFACDKLLPGANKFVATVFLKDLSDKADFYFGELIYNKTIITRDNHLFFTE